VTFKKPALPVSMGRCADLYHDVRELRLAMEKEVAEVAAFESEMRQHIIENLSKSEDTGAAGLKYRAQIVTKTVPKIRTDEENPNVGWPQFWDYVAKNMRFDLMQKRFADKAIKDMWEAGETVPGVEPMKVPDVSITKI
jgi:hypothetical protein